MKWVFDYCTFWNPETDTIKVLYGGVLVGCLYNEAPARVMQARLQGESLQAGDADPAVESEPISRAAPEVAATADAPIDPASSLDAVPDPAAVPTPAPPVDPPPLLPGTPELIRVTCDGPLKNAIYRVLGNQDGLFRVVVVSDGEYKDTETAVSPENCVPQAAGSA